MKINEVNINEKKNKSWEPCPRCQSRRVKEDKSWLFYIFLLLFFMLLIYDIETTVSFLGIHIDQKVSWWHYALLGLGHPIIAHLYGATIGFGLKCKDCDYEWNVRNKDETKPTLQADNMNTSTNELYELTENKPSILESIKSFFTEDVFKRSDEFKKPSKN